MKIVAAAMLAAFCAYAQAKAVQLPTACGPAGDRFTVQDVGATHVADSLQPGKAILYLIQDEGHEGKRQFLLVRIGMDGSWIGAYRQNSFFAIPVDPGTHHLCANVQSRMSVGEMVGLAHFVAEPGKTYYLRTRILTGVGSPYATPAFLEIDRIDSDEAGYLISTYPRAQWAPVK